MNKICIIIKFFIILGLILIFINIYNKSLENKTEGFNQEQDYIKLNETYIEPEGTNLKLLYFILFIKPSSI